MVHRAGEKADRISRSEDPADVTDLANAEAILAEAQLRLMEQLSRRPVGDGVPLGERERRWEPRHSSGGI
jgi:hypothetical protein